MKEEKPDYIVVGAGPAGAAFTYYASQKGYRVHVYEMSLPGRKPCGWAVPSLIEKYLKMPEEAVLEKIRGYRVFLDGELLFESREPGWGWIVDKPKLLEILLEQAEAKHYRKPLKTPYQGPPIDPRNGSKLVARENIVYSTGSAWPYSPSEKINAVQILLKRTNSTVEPGIVEVWFESSMVGYFWVFPRGEKLVDIGVGGYLDYYTLEEKLKRFAIKRLNTRNLEVVGGIKGARIVVEGINQKLFERDKYPVIGEAAGFVLPISGEGIRPAIASAYALYKSLETNNSRTKIVKDIVEWVKRQRRLLEKIKSGKPQARAAVLKALPPEIMIGIGLGSLKTKDLLRIVVKMPLTVARIIKYMLEE